MIDGSRLVVALFVLTLLAGTTTPSLAQGATVGAELVRDVDGDADLSRVQPDASAGEVVYDAAVLRPLSFIQLAFSAVIFVPAYPISLLFGGSDDVMRACIREPVHRTFGRTLGHR